MGVVIILCGMPFSGKTRAARILGERFGCAIVSLDEINAERGVGHGGEGLADEVWAETHRLGVERVEGLIRAGCGAIVVDDTNCFRFLRDGWREMASRHGYRHALVALEVRPEELRRRMVAAERTGERRGMTDSVFQECLRRFEWPSAEEEPVVIGPGDDAPARLGAILKAR